MWKFEEATVGWREDAAMDGGRLFDVLASVMDSRKKQTQ